MDEFESEWCDAVYGTENDSVLHICGGEGESAQCVDCAKTVTCWNDNDIYLICTDCLAVESELEMNQVPEGDSPYAHLSEEEKKEIFFQQMRENPNLFSYEEDEDF